MNQFFCPWWQRAGAPAGGETISRRTVSWNGRDVTHGQAGMFGGKAPLCLAAQKNRPQAPLAFMRS